MSISNEKNEKYKKINATLNQIICNNLQELLKARNLSQVKFCKLLSEEKTCVTRPYLSRILKDPSHISAAFLLSCCDFFGITLENLCSPNFDANEYVSRDTSLHKDYLNIKAIMNEYKEQQAVTNNDIDKTESEKNPNFLFPFTDTNLITDPKHTLFSGYIQDYYCYYYSTHSSENKNDESILRGILRLEAENNYCKATLTINTNTVDDNGKINYKEYVGYAVISPTVNSLHCVMYSDSICEFCFLMFRLFKLNFGKQDCRIAEVLSSSSISEHRRPTVLRMFLSKEPVKASDLKVISPALFLNYSTIVIDKENLCKIGGASEEYEKIIADLLATNNSQEVYFCKEKEIFSIAQRHLENKEVALEFLMQFRSLSFSNRYNKVSPKADDAVRDILCSRGYYKKRVVTDNDLFMGKPDGV